MKKMPPMLLFALIVQVLCLAFVVMAPIGFDKPSSWGLDFAHFLFAALTYLLALLGGIVAAALAKAWRLLLAQLALPLAGALLLIAQSGGI